LERNGGGGWSGATFQGALSERALKTGEIWQNTFKISCFLPNGRI